jgi:hypothetical protein
VRVERASGVVVADVDHDVVDHVRRSLIRMPPAGFEPAARCLEGSAERYDGR